MDHLKAMHIFVQVVEKNSFTKAADSLGIARSTVTETVQELEKKLSVSLMARTTRKLNLTPEGDRYYRCCKQIFEALRDVEAEMKDGEPLASETQL